MFRDRLSAFRHQQGTGYATEHSAHRPGHDRANQGASRAGRELFVYTLLAAVDSRAASLCGSFCHTRLQSTATADEIYQHHHDGNDQQDVNKPADGVGRNQTEQPQNQKYYSNCPEHMFPFVP